MSKRTTPGNKTTSETPAPRPRATKPEVETTPAEAPKAPRTRRKATTTEVTAAADVTAAAGSRQQPSHDQIAIRAYFIALEQGADPTAAWLLAERELTIGVA